MNTLCWLATYSLGVVAGLLIAEDLLGWSFIPAVLAGVVSIAMQGPGKARATPMRRRSRGKA